MVLFTGHLILGGIYFLSFNKYPLSVFVATFSSVCLSYLVTISSSFTVGNCSLSSVAKRGETTLHFKSVFSSLLPSFQASRGSLSPTATWLPSWAPSWEEAWELCPHLGLVACWYLLQPSSWFSQSTQTRSPWSQGSWCSHTHLKCIATFLKWIYWKQF